MFTLTKEFAFEAAHYLEGLPDSHPCSRLHGHSYKVIITLKGGYLNETGFLRDYRELDEVKEWLNEKFDHKCLNQALKFNPTAENLARQIFYYFSEKIPELSAVTVKETEKTSATYERY